MAIQWPWCGKSYGTGSGARALTEVELFGPAQAEQLIELRLQRHGVVEVGDLPVLVRGLEVLVAQVRDLDASHAEQPLDGRLVHRDGGQAVDAHVLHRLREREGDGPGAEGLLAQVDHVHGLGVVEAVDQAEDAGQDQQSHAHREDHL